jgi:hypothetical protein
VDIFQKEKNDVFFRRVAVSLVELCRENAVQSRILAASVGLINRIYRTMPLSSVLKEITDGFLSGYLVGLAQVPCGFASEMFSYFIDHHDSLRVKNGELDFVDRNSFKSQSDFERNMKGLGRAMGMILGHCPAVPRSVIKIHKAAYMSIYAPVSSLEPLMRQTLSRGERRDTRETIRDLIQERYSEPAFFVRLGITDIIGPAGIYIWTPQRWEQFFALR